MCNKIKVQKTSRVGSLVAKKQEKKKAREQGNKRTRNFKFHTCYLINLSTCFLILFLLTYFLISCLYGKGAGTTAGTTMLQTYGVRQMALGGCGVSISNDIYSMYFNPAGLSGISEKQLSSLFSSGLSNDYKASVVYVHPIDVRKKSTVAFGIFHLNGGMMEINYVDGTSEDVISQSDFLVTIGWGKRLSKNTSIGYNIKYLSTKLAEKYSASAVALDAGLNVSVLGGIDSADSPNGKKLKLGVSAQNYGSVLKYRSKEESLPSLLRGGISYKFPLDGSNAILAAVDGFYLVKEKDTYGSAGIEHSIYQKYFLRGGCRILTDRNSFTLGAGLKFYERFSVDWATELSILNNPHNISFSMKF